MPSHPDCRVVGGFIVVVQVVERTVVGRVDELAGGRLIQNGQLIDGNHLERTFVALSLIVRSSAPLLTHHARFVLDTLRRAGLKSSLFFQRKEIGLTGQISHLAPE